MIEAKGVLKRKESRRMRIENDKEVINDFGENSFSGAVCNT